MKKLLLMAVAASLMIGMGAEAQVNRVPQLGVVDNAGATQVNIEGQKATYFAGALNITPAAAATDVAVLVGSATKTVKVTRVKVTLAATTTAGQVDVALIKRVGGSQSAVSTAFVPNTNSGLADSGSPVSSVVATGFSGIYTANPGSVGTVAGQVAMWSTIASVTSPNVFIYECTVPSQCPTLRGLTQLLAVNLNGDTLLTAEKFGVEFTWTEE